MALEAEHKKRYDGVDMMKFICAILVVAIHAVPFTEFSQLWAFETEQVISRISVPFFFICSGYFFTRKLMGMGTDMAAAMRAVVKRLLWLYAAWCGIYFAYDFRMCLKATGNLGEAGLLYVRNLIFLGGHFHLWYVPALMVSMLLLYAGIRLRMMPQFLGMAVGLYIFGLAGNSYYGFVADVPWLRDIYSTYFQVFVTTRNGLFFGFLYVMLGGMAVFWKPTLPYTRGLLLSIVFLLLLHAEVYLLEANRIPREYDMYIMTAPFTFCLLQTLIGSGIKLKEKGGEFLRNSSMGIYFIHGLFLILYEKFFQWSGILVMGTVYFLLVAGSSVAAIWVLNKVKNPVLQSLIR